jgi:gluconolactonase
MPENRYVRPTVSVLPSFNPLLAPQPAIAPLTPPAHVVDLMTAEGSAAFGSRWRGREAKIIEVPALSDAMPEFKTTYDIDPHAEVLGFDDADWPVIAATDLGARRGGGLVSFFWFRAILTIPPAALGFATDGTKAVLRINIDDYAEIWVNGALPRAAGRPSPGCIQGFNMPHRLVLGDNIVHPGERYEVAVFAINGPLSAGPANFLWFREARVEFYR